ncbi:MAG: signal recognition particle-docking protein FtsY [Candidatus Micrarchaeota archaeon]|nr:signal recognition particle-docking protein FtsY [Candidatus Micrarchaeota archaeon]MDE1849315.1 signal recognition particle-docking protein FtsY [Candidatus Micrarchaeota archaeon]
MFEGLKKKFSNFIDNITKKENEEVKEEAKEGKAEEREEPAQAAPAQEQEKMSDIEKEEKAEEIEEEESDEAQYERQMAKGSEGEEAKPEAQEQEHEQVRQGRDSAPKPQEERKGIRLSAATRIKGFIFGQVEIKEKDVSSFLEGLRMDLLQSDVNYDVAERMVGNLSRELVGMKVNSRDIEREVRSSVRSSILRTIAKKEGSDMVSMAREKKHKGEMPFRILFLGPNGAGKTTTMAKVARMLLDNGFSCVMSASDTFRAAAMEQTAIHAQRLGISVIKGAYGADPASIAFDAIAHAKAHGIDVVLMDSAGRQETNRSLIEELKKMARVTMPDMKIFVGEGIAGNALLNQVKAINEAVRIDGIILTKLDVDAKGGNTISILSDTTIPILFFGMGEKYSDLMAYDPEFIINNIVPDN